MILNIYSLSSQKAKLTTETERLKCFAGNIYDALKAVETHLSGLPGTLAPEGQKQ